MILLYSFSAVSNWLIQGILRFVNPAGLYCKCLTVFGCVEGGGGCFVRFSAKGR